MAAQACLTLLSISGSNITQLGNYTYQPQSAPLLYSTTQLIRAYVPVYTDSFNMRTKLAATGHFLAVAPASMLRSSHN